MPRHRLWGVQRLAQTGRAFTGSLRLRGREALVRGGSEYHAWVAGPRQGPRPAPADAPLISILMAVHHPPVWFLEQAVASVQEQSYPNWELVVCVDGPHESEVMDILREAAGMDSRVRILDPGAQRGIVAALNDALRISTGTFLGILDHDDLLHERAVELMTQHLLHCADTDLVYSDEDKVDSAGRHYDPYFKPDFSPDLLVASMYLNHFTVMRRSAVEAVGGFRTGTDGAQDHDLALRMARAGAHICHVPGVLYHWRAWPGSTAAGIHVKPWAQEAAQQVQAAHFKALGLVPDVQPSAIPGINDVRSEVRGDPLVTVVVVHLPAPGHLQADQALLRALRSIPGRGGWENVQLVVAHTGALDPRTTQAARSLGANLEALPGSRPDVAAAAMIGATAGDGDFLMILDSSGVIQREGSIHALLEMAQLDGVGATGPRVVTPRGRQLGSGVLILDGSPSTPFEGAPAGGTGYFGSLVTPRNYRALKGPALMTPRSMFLDAGGLDARWSSLSMAFVDYCLRLGERGLRCTYTPYALVVDHHERRRAGAKEPHEDLARFRMRWGNALGPDPYYSPLLTRSPLYRVR